MKIYSKIYEDIFSKDKKLPGSTMNLEKISISSMEEKVYIETFRNLLNSFYLELFNACVRITWLRTRFAYNGKHVKMPAYRSSRFTNASFVKYLRRIIGKDIQIMTRAKFFAKLETYFNELFPGFEDGNPFDNPDYYKFPYKNISVDYLIVVSQMDERIGLLKEAENKKMGYASFVDYVINHAYCVNAELGKAKYEISLNVDRNFSFYVRNLDKDLTIVKGKKRP